MNLLTRFAVSRRSVTLLATVALFVAGIAAWGGLKQELLPDVSFPIVTVIAPYPGAGATDVTEQVTEPIEQALSTVPGLSELRTTSATSLSFAVAQFEYGTDLDEAVSTIETNLRRVTLPQGVEPTVGAFNFNEAPVVVASISTSAGTDLEAATAIATEEVVPELESLPGVANVDLAGGLEDRLVVTLDPALLAETGVSAQQVAAVLQANNVTIPGGELPVDGVEIPVSTIGQFASESEIEALVVGVRQTAPAPPEAQPVPVTIGQLGTVEQLSLNTTGYARTNGQDAITISVSKTSAANTVEVADAVQATLEDIGGRHADEVEIVTVSDQSVFIIESADGLLREGGLGAVFAVLTIFAFLLSVRSTFVAAISIPLSILTALVIMQVTGITLNILTLGGLAVAIGRVVDDSIVVLENIYRHRALGDDRTRAVLDGTREVSGAIAASTLTTVAVFLPLGFAGGFVSEFFLAFSLTVTFALVASLVVALTVVPVLGYYLVGRRNIQVDETGEPTNSFWVRLYDPLIRGVLRNRWTELLAVLGAGALFVASTALIPLLPTAFVNSGSEKILSVIIAPPAGASSQDVLDRAIEAETILIDDPDVRVVSTSVPAEGDVGFMTVLAAQQGRAGNSATMIVRLDPAVDLPVKSEALADALAPVGTDGYEVTVGQQGGTTSNSLSVIVTAEDPAVVAETAAAVETALEDEPDLTNVGSDLSVEAPEVQVRVDPDNASAVGLTAAQVGAQVRSALTPQTVGLVRIGDAEAVPLVLGIDASDLTSVEALEAMPVGATVAVPLGTVADVEETSVQSRITRIDGAPAATVSAEITSEDIGATSQAVQATLDDLVADGTIPATADVRLGGVSAQQAEAFAGLFGAMGVAILLVYVCMVLTFSSLVTPFIILFSLPLATIGAFPALLLTGRPIGLSALIGFLMLIGIVVTNAIVLLDLVERLRREGLSTRDALIRGGHTRIRPILMTAIATILALVPLAAGFNEGSIIAAELGTVVIGGLLSSTVLTLLVIPALYSLVARLRGHLPGGGSTSG